jgi:hypothetical protein
MESTEVKTVLAALGGQYLICDTDDITAVNVHAVTTPVWKQGEFVEHAPTGKAKVILTFDQTSAPEWVPAARTTHLISREAVEALWDYLPDSVRDGRRPEDVAEWAAAVLDATWKVECGEQ